MKTKLDYENKYTCVLPVMRWIGERIEATEGES